jgi:hypothetical protein
MKCSYIFAGSFDPARICDATLTPPRMDLITTFTGFDVVFIGSPRLRIARRLNTGFHGRLDLHGILLDGNYDPEPRADKS